MTTMQHAIFVVLAALFCLISGFKAQNFETGDNSTVIGCSNHCSYEDPSLECWNKTLQFFEHLLLGQMRHYTAVQINIDQWRRRNVNPYRSEFDYRKQLSIEKIKLYLQKDDIVSAETVESVIDVLMDHAAVQSNRSILWVPHFSCPLPCEHRYVVWRNLFIVSTLLNLALLVSVIPFVKRMTKNDASEALIYN